MPYLVKVFRSLRQIIHKRRWLLRLIGVAVFVLILTRINWKDFLAIIQQVNLGWVAASIALQGLALLITTWRWQMIMKHLGIRVAYSRTLIHQLTGTGVAMITPGQLGEFIKVVYHRGMGFPIAESALSIVIDRAYDFAMLCFFGFLAMTVLFGVQISSLILIAAAAILIAVAAFFYLRNRETNTRRIAKLLTKVAPAAYKEAIQQNIERLVNLVLSMRPKLLLACVLLSFGNYCLLLLKVYLLALSVHMDVSFWYFASAVPIFRLAGLLPISISGIGTRDAVIIYILGRVGVTAESSLILSLLSLVTLQLQALIGALLWWRYPPAAVEGAEGDRREYVRNL